MVRVLLDTNALMMPIETDVRLFEELERLLVDVEPLVPRAVIRELEHLAASGAGTEATAASVGRDLADDRCTVLDHEESAADDAIAELATAGEAEYVCTNDAPLKRRLLDAGVSVVSLRASHNLAITQP
jgi:rRNA-processing protein FCF1